MKGERNEVMRLDLRGQLFATEVVLSLKLGRNEVFDYLLGGCSLGESEVSPLASPFPYSQCPVMSTKRAKRTRGDISLFFRALTVWVGGGVGMLGGCVNKSAKILKPVKCLTF
jgi:hypothetical protein